VQALAVSKGDASVLSEQLAMASAGLRNAIDDLRRGDRIALDAAVMTVAQRQDEAGTALAKLKAEVQSL